MPDIELKPCDIMATRSKGRLGRLIRFFTRRIGESKSRVNHIGQVVHGGTLETAIVVEALSPRVVHRPLWDGYGCKSAPDATIFRPLNLTDEDIAVITRTAESYVGRRYGYLKLGTNLLDWVATNIRAAIPIGERRDVYLFRRLTHDDNYPMCSWITSHSYAKRGKDFGVKAGAATPDDIWDFCLSHPEKYAVIVPLGSLTQFRRRETP